MPESDWIITTSPERSIAQIRKELASAGFEVSEVLAEIGVITGRGSPAAVARLRGRPGIADIAPAGGVDIGPPGSDPGW